MTFSMSDVLRVEAGIFPKLRELPNILSLLGLELAELTPTERESLCGVFYSVPYNHRLDGGLLAVYLELGLRLLKAVSRAESMRTIAGAPELAVKVKEMQAVVTSLLPKGVHQNAAIETT